MKKFIYPNNGYNGVVGQAGTALRTCEVPSTKMTHLGRHAGVVEAFELGLDPEYVRFLGRWVMGQMEVFYAPKNPIMGAFYMAHFNNRVDPYFIERDLIVPPLELQRLISPWIKHSFDKDQPSHAHFWKL